MSNIPPLSQSKEAQMACETSYVAIQIDGRKVGPSIASDRGSEVHEMMAQYVKHCAAKKTGSDWIAFNHMTRAVGLEAGSILNGIRDRYIVPWKTVFDAEVTMMLDEEFNPTTNISEQDWPKHVKVRNLITSLPEGDYAAHIGTLDLIEISNDDATGKISDYKTSPSIFDADTYQGKLYSFMLFKHFPQLERVIFSLIFCRYQNCVREVVYERSDMPEMQEAIGRARERQKVLHDNPESAEATPCTQCSYCPLGVLTLECPIREVNPHLSLTAEQRLRFKEWSRRMNDTNTPLLKAYSEVNGPVRFKDGSGQVYEYGHLEVPVTSYPLDRTTIQVLTDYSESTGEDLLDGRLNISSTKLKGLLRAKKRAPLADVFENSIIQTATKPKWAVRTPSGIEEDFNPYAGDE